MESSTKDNNEPDTLDDPVTDPVEENQANPSSADPTEQSANDPPENVQTPEFADLPTSRSESGTTLDRLYDVNVEVTAEIGRVSMTLGELLRIGEGAVIKLDRQVTAPVELVAQGVRVAKADVIVIDDCFAVRIRDIERAR